VKERRAVRLAAALFVVGIAVAVHFWPMYAGATKTYQLNVMNDTRQPLSIDAYVLTAGSPEKGVHADAKDSETKAVHVSVPATGQHLVLVAATTISKDTRTPPMFGIKLVTLPPLADPVESKELAGDGILGFWFGREDMVEHSPHAGLDGTKMREVRRDLLKKALEYLEPL